MPYLRFTFLISSNLNVNAKQVGVSLVKTICGTHAYAYYMLFRQRSIGTKATSKAAAKLK